MLETALKAKLSAQFFYMAGPLIAEFWRIIVNEGRIIAKRSDLIAGCKGIIADITLLIAK